MPALTAKAIAVHLKTVRDWTKHGQTILRKFKFKGFLDSIAFVNHIAKKAEKHNHHPDIDIRFNRVTLKLTTHDEGGLTEKDFSLAKQCNEAFSKLAGH